MFQPAPVQIPLPGDASAAIVAAPTTVICGSPANPVEAPLPPMGPAGDMIAATTPKCDWTEHTSPDGRTYYYNSGKSFILQRSFILQGSYTLLEMYMFQCSLFFFHSCAIAVTRKSSWEKPDELKTSTELLLSRCPWKEYKSDSGRLYYYNAETKESKWTIPKELEDIRRLLEMEGKAKTTARLDLVSCPFILRHFLCLKIEDFNLRISFVINEGC